MPKDIPDFEDVVKSIGEVQTAFNEFKSTVADRDKELLTKGAADVLIEEKLARINDHIGEHQSSIDKLYAATKRKHFKIDGKDVSEEELDAKALNWAQLQAKARGTQITEYGAADLNEYKTAFQKYLRKDDRVLSADEQKALSVGSDPDGGYTVHPDMSGRMVQFMFETSPMRNFASVQVISTDALEGLSDLDEVTSGWVNETEARAETDTPQLKAWRIPVHEQYAAPRATQKILDDSAIDIEGWLLGKVADKMGRTENTAFVTGNGVGKPRGFTTYADWTTAGTFEHGKIEQFDTGVNGDFAADPNGGDKLVEMIYALKAPYRMRANWFMNRTTMGAVRLLKDSDGRMLWQPSLAAGQPSTLLGYGIGELDDMADYSTTGALGIAFGDMAATYQIVERLGTRILRDPYTAKPYVIFYATRRVGGDVLDFDALKLLKFSA